MKGLEIAEGYFTEYGLPAIEREHPELMDMLAFGLVGSGSECLGYDDEVSADHDFEPGFCIFLPGEDVVDRRSAFLLERTYAKLPKEYMGLKRKIVSPVGGSRHGVMRTADFYLEHAGISSEEPDMYGWLKIPSYALRESTCGKVFRDIYGEFSRIRENLLMMPEDIRRKRLSGHLLLMAQSGQYNYERTLAHGEKGAAALAGYEFVRSAMECVFLLNRSYMPYYKWSFRALRDLCLPVDMEGWLYRIISEGNERDEAEEKIGLIGRVCRYVSEELSRQGLSSVPGDDLEKHAYSVNNGITDGEIRNLGILFAV